MTDRDELTRACQPAYDAVYSLIRQYRTDAVDNARIWRAVQAALDALADAGWQPPPSGDVIKRAMRVVADDERFLIPAARGAGGGYLLPIVLGVLADAGLLAHPASTGDETVEVFAQRDNGEFVSCTRFSPEMREAADWLADRLRKSGEWESVEIRPDRYAGEDR